MATVLLAWELGEGLAHAQRLLRVGRELASQGHRLVFALAYVAEPWPLFQNDSFSVVQAPYWNFYNFRGQPFAASSLADVLAVRGWETPSTLLPLVESWKNLLELVQPHLIVADYSPTLCLAAYQTLPVVQVGSWFGMPPVDKDQFPLLVPGRAPMLAQDKLLAVVQDVQRLRQQPVPPTLASILAAGDRFPTFFPELDPYQSERTDPVWDPMDALPGPVVSKPEQRFFAYLTADNPAVEPLLTHLAMTGIPGTVYLRSALGDLKERLRLLGLEVLDEPAPLGDMLARCAVIVHHGGSMANSVLAAGRPQILVPQHLEQTTTAQILARLGVALVLLGNVAPEAVARALRQILGERRFADNAVAWAGKINNRPRRPALPAIVACCQRRLDAVQK